MATETDISTESDAIQGDKTESTVPEPLPENYILVDKEVADLADYFIKLVTELHRLYGKLGTSENELEVYVDTVVAVKRFLDANPAVFAAGITRPLGTLASKLQDILIGGDPVKIFPVADKPAHRPSGLSGLASLQAATAACVEIFVRYKLLSVKGACEFVLETLNQYLPVERHYAEPITWKTIKNWRDEMGGRNSDTAYAIYKQHLNRFEAAVGDKKISLESAQRFTIGCLQGLKDEGAVRIKI